MSKARNYQTEAIIIKKNRLAEADSVLTLLSPEFGKIQAVAKSVRKPRSKMAGHLELLTHSLVTFSHGRNLDIITGSQTINAFLPLKTNFILTAYGLYIIELINRFTADEVNEENIFILLKNTLQNLCETNNPDTLSRYFEMKLLEFSGYNPQLQQCVICRKELTPVINSFSSISGGCVCPMCAHKQPFTVEITVNALKVLRFIQNNNYDTVSRLVINDKLGKELERLTRYYIKHILDSDVRSITYLDELRKQLEKKPDTKSIP